MNHLYEFSDNNYDPKDLVKDIFIEDEHDSENSYFHEVPSALSQKCPDPAPFCDRGNCYSIKDMIFSSKL
ncbi:2629_t:CDS:2 [Entrophospora sp. SA101]|nr:2629_t:CDS:2 [Entrophospora sp. SA101]